MSLFRSVATAAVALTLTATPALAGAATANTASKLSLQNTRVSTPAKRANGLAGAGVVPLVLLAGIIAGGVLLVVDEEDDDSDSN